MSRCKKSRKIKIYIHGNCTCDVVKGEFTCVCNVGHDPKFITFNDKPASATNQMWFVIRSIVTKTHSWKWTLNTLSVVSSGELCMAYLLKLKQSIIPFCSKKEVAQRTLFRKGLWVVPDYSWPRLYHISVPVFSHIPCQLILYALSQIYVLITAK